MGRLTRGAGPGWDKLGQPGHLGEATARSVVLVLSRFLDVEHTFRLLKQTLGWTTPKLPNPEAADR